MIGIIIAVAFSSAPLGVPVMNVDAVMPSCAYTRAVISALIEDDKHESQYPIKADIVLIDRAPDILKRQASVGTRDRNDADLFWASWIKAPDKNRPTRALIKAWRHSSSESAFRCFQAGLIDGLKTVSTADARQIRNSFSNYNQGVVTAASLLDYQNSERLVTLAYGMPVFNSNKTEALIPYSATCGIVCGSSGFYLMAKRNSGKWVKRATRAVAVF